MEILLTITALVVFGFAYKIYDSILIVYAVIIIMAKLGEWDKGTIIMSFIIGTIMHLIRLSFFAVCQEQHEKESIEKDDEK